MHDDMKAALADVVSAESLLARAVQRLENELARQSGRKATSITPVRLWSQVYTPMVKAVVMPALANGGN